MCSTVAPLVPDASEITNPLNAQSRFRTSVSRCRFCVAGDPSTELYAAITDRAPARNDATNGGKYRSISARSL